MTSPAPIDRSDARPVDRKQPVGSAVGFAAAIGAVSGASLCGGRGSKRTGAGAAMWDTRAMSSAEIDAYLAALDEPKRDTLETLRRSILEVVPDAEEGLAYGMPAFKVRGKTVAGFAAFKNHLSYLPHSGSVLAELGDEVARYETSKGSLKFAVDKPLPKRLVKKLITTRMKELGLAP
jgi:uncharacterized protein YdhG (YjbR/CyaY superfamily)